MAIGELIAAAAVAMHNRRRRGESRSLLGSLDPDANIFMVGSKHTETDERLRERLLTGRIEQIRDDGGLGGVVLCSTERSFRRLYDLYGGDEAFLFFGENASYDYLAGVPQTSFEEGMRELLDGTDCGTIRNVESVLDVFVRHLGVGSYEELSECAEELRGSVSVGDLLYRLEQRGITPPRGFEMLVNNRWENDVPSFLTFFDRFEADIRRAQTNTAPYWSLARAVAEHRIAVVCISPSDRYLRAAILTELLWLDRNDYPYDLVSYRAELSGRLGEELLNSMTDQQRLCLISSTVAECGLELDRLARMTPVIVCIGAVGSDAEALSRFYNSTYRETSVNVHMHRGIGVGFGQAMMPTVEPALLTPQRIYRGGAVILESGGYRVCSYLLV